MMLFIRPLGKHAKKKRESKARQDKTENFTSLWFGLKRIVCGNLLKKNKNCNLKSNLLGVGLDMDILFQTLKTFTINIYKYIYQL